MSSAPALCSLSGFPNWLKFPNYFSVVVLLSVFLEMSSAWTSKETSIFSCLSCCPSCFCVLTTHRGVKSMHPPASNQVWLTGVTTGWRRQLGEWSKANCLPGSFQATWLVSLGSLLSLTKGHDLEVTSPPSVPLSVLKDSSVGVAWELIRWAGSGPRSDLDLNSIHLQTKEAYLISGCIKYENSYLPVV